MKYYGSMESIRSKTYRHKHMANGTIKFKDDNAIIRTFKYGSLNIQVYVFPTQLRVVRVFTTSAITQAYVGWTNVGAYTDGLASCVVHSDTDKLIGLRESNGQLQINIPSSISNLWVVGTAVSVA